MHQNKKNVLLIAMPFAGTTIPSIQLPILKGYLEERDITIQTRHMYLKAADIYGLKNYNYLIYPPNDSYTAQMVFSKYVFPEHWKKTKEKCKQYFNRNTTNSDNSQQTFSFEDYINKTDRFYKWTLEHIDWTPYDLIGFTLNYGQFLPSLAVAKKIKEEYPEKKIVLGGSRTAGNLGKRVLKAFNFVDFIVSGDGEEALYLLASNQENQESIPHLIYRSEEDVVWNESQDNVDLNDLPVPSYDAFYKELDASSIDVKKYFQYYGRLPVEISRGCWWNKCSFCNLNIQYSTYREKSVDNIVEEIQCLSEAYKILSFQMIGNTLPKKDYRVLCRKIKELGKDFTFFIEARAGRLKSDDYRLLKEAGFSAIQTGIEAFSPHYLKKMNKGTRVIDNIAALKFCKEHGITNKYNIIVNYPNEEQIDFEETRETIQSFKQYLDPPQVCPLRVVFGSTIYNHPQEFNIKRLEPAPVDKIMFPPAYLEKGISFVYEFTPKEEVGEHNWDQLADEWKNKREQLVLRGSKSQIAVDYNIFYFVDGGNFLKIYDKRNVGNTNIFILDETEREIFLACVDVTSFHELQKQFSSLPEYQLAAILHTLEQNGILFREDDRYLSLPLRHNAATYQPPRKEEAQVALQNSGSHRSR